MNSVKNFNFNTAKLLYHITFIYIRTANIFLLRGYIKYFV